MKKLFKINKKLVSTYAILHLAVFILSLSTICSKFAAREDFLSVNFFLLYAGVILALGVYAVIWQQVLKKIPLTDAFVNKSASLIWSLVWGVALFDETVSASMILGLLIVAAGVILVISDSPKEAKLSQKESVNE